jgi:sugar lactone lactonase YvrE
VWGLAIDSANRRLFVGSPATATIYAVDLTADAPVATVYLTGAGGPNGLTMGPDGALYYSDFSGSHVYRVTGADAGARTRVTTSTIAQANGVAFHRDGSLYVDSFSAGSLIRLTLVGHVESTRRTIATSLGSPDGLAFDARDRIYVSDNAGGRLIRLDADGANPEVLRTGISAAANIEFGAGALPCTDVYVASGGALVRYEMGDTNGASVPWH